MDAETAAILDELARGLDAAARAVDRLAARYRKGRAPADVVVSREMGARAMDPAPRGEPDRHTKERHEWPTAFPRGEARPGEPALEPRPKPAAAKGGAGPRTGKALFAWLKDCEQEHGAGLLRYVEGWGKLQSFPKRMVEWDAGQVRAGHAEAVRKISQAAKGE